MQWYFRILDARLSDASVRAYAQHVESLGLAHDDPLRQYFGDWRPMHDAWLRSLKAVESREVSTVMVCVTASVPSSRDSGADVGGEPGSGEIVCAFDAVSLLQVRRPGGVRASGQDAAALDWDMTILYTEVDTMKREIAGARHHGGAHSLILNTVEGAWVSMVFGSLRVTRGVEP